MSQKALKTIFLLAFALVGIILSMTSCSKRDSQCDFYTRGELKLVKHGKDAGNCYYLEKSKPVYLQKEDCAWYCD